MAQLLCDGIRTQWSGRTWSRDCVIEFGHTGLGEHGPGIVSWNSGTVVWENMEEGLCHGIRTQWSGRAWERDCVMEFGRSSLGEHGPGIM